VLVHAAAVRGHARRDIRLGGGRLLAGVQIP
jgi:hypothetical protein